MSLQLPPDELLEPFFPLYEYLVDRLRLMSQVDPNLVYTSWFRDVRQNEIVGGSPQSQHLFGFAIDFTTDSPEQMSEVAKRLGLIPVIEWDHVHLQLFPAGLLERFGFFGTLV